LNHREKY